MPLDTSTYALALLRLDGRRWNELRRMHGSIRTQAAADGSAYLELGNTKVVCTVTGPSETRRGGGGGGGGGGDDDKATVTVELSVAAFSGVDRKRRGRTDRRTLEMQRTLAAAFGSTLATELFPRSGIAIALHVLAADGSVLAACVNAATLALVDAGVPMPEYLVACTAGSAGGAGRGGTGGSAGGEGDADPLMDLNAVEEGELPFLTVATIGAGERVCVLVMETRVPAARLEGMLAVGVDGCKQVREILDGVVRRHGKKVLAGAAG